MPKSGKSEPARPKGILFDKDGTLFDYAKSWSAINLDAARLAASGDEALRVRLLERGGADPETGLATADTLLAAGNAAEIAAAWVAHGSPLETVELTHALDDLFREAVSRMAPVTDQPGLFAGLKAHGARIGIASSDGAAAVADTVRHFGLTGLVDFIAGYDSGHGYKPEAGMFTAFCAACRLEPHEVAMVGDNLHDMEMGRRGGAGWRIGVLTGTGTRQTLTPASDMVLDSIEGLEQALFGDSLSG
jgi:phosphoglycolate phosphatase